MNKKKNIIFYSFGIAGLFLVITLIVSNQPVVMSSENSLFKCYEYLKFTSNENSLDLEDSVVLVNTHFSMKTVKEQDYGNVAVVDRDTLYEFLQYLKRDSTYRYIILDVIFDKLDREEKDTALYNLISSMPRIVIAMPEDGRIADTCLIRKAGEVGYNITAWESDFVKYPFIQNGNKSLALKMYEELYNDTVKKSCCFCLNKGFMRKSATLTYSYTNTEFIYTLHKVKNGIDIGIEDKYVLIGDFNDDVHTTFMGDLPGPIINFNAYMTLVKGYHRVGLIVLLILFLAYFFLVYQTLVYSKFTWLFMWIGYPVFLATLNFVIYYLFNEIYDVLVTTSLFYILKTIVESYRERNVIRERISTILLGVKQLYVCFKSSIIGLWKKIKVIVLFVLVICTSKSYSQDYFEILSLSHPHSIKIGGVMKNAKRNKIFNEKDKIEWTDALQWIKAKKVNDRSKNYYKFSFHEFKKLGVSTAHDYIIKKKHLAHKGAQRVITGEDVYYLLGKNDTLFLERKEQNNERRIVKAKWKCDEYQGESQIFPTSDGRFYVIPSGIFLEIQSLPKSISLSIREEFLEENSIYNVYPKIEVYYLPD